MGLLLRLTWRTLAARPTLAVMAILLLAMTASLLYGLVVSANVIGSLRGSLINELAVEIELAGYNDSTRFVMAEQLRARPDVLNVTSLSAREILEEVEQDLGESLRDVLTENPFPPILRVKLRSPSPERIELFVSDVSSWPGVLHVVYPKDLWQKFDAWLTALKGKIAYAVVALALFGWMLAGLTLRAILRNRRNAWQLLTMLGIKPRELEVVQLLIELSLGVFAGLLTIGLIQLGLLAAEWLLLSPVQPPTAWVLGCLGTAIGLAVLTGIWAPRLSMES